MLAWQTTRNTLEASALAALDIPVQPVTSLDHKSGNSITDWTLQCDNSDALPQGRNTVHYITGQIRRDYASGDMAKTTPLHPYMISMRTVHNRTRFLDAQRHHTVMHIVEDAPGSYLLMPGAAPAVTGPYLDTLAQDLALALITCGHALISLTHNGNAHIYRIARFSAEGSAGIHSRTDAGILMPALRSNLLWPARRWEPFAHASHTLHCLRELRRVQHTDRFIVVRHKTFQVRGAAFKENARSAIQSAVQTKLGIKI